MLELQVLTQQCTSSSIQPSKKERLAKHTVFNLVLVPTITYGHYCWAMTERVPPLIRTSEMRDLQSISEVTLFDCLAIREYIRVELLLLLYIEDTQLQCYEFMVKLKCCTKELQNRFFSPSQVKPSSRRPERKLENMIAK